MQQAPRWDSHIVETYHETIRYYRHLITLEQPEYEEFITWARVPYLGSKETKDASDYPLDPVSEEHRSLEEDGPMGREWLLRTAAEALAGIEDEGEDESADGQKAAPEANWLVTKSPICSSPSTSGATSTSMSNTSDRRALTFPRTTSLTSPWPKRRSVAMMTTPLEEARSQEVTSASRSSPATRTTRASPIISLLREGGRPDLLGDAPGPAPLARTPAHPACRGVGMQWWWGRRIERVRRERPFEHQW